MEIQKTDGIILSSYLFGEADNYSRVYTREFGKRDFIFKGIKKSKKRSKLITELGTIANLIYYYNEKKNSYVVNEFTIHKHYLKIRNNLKKILHLSFILETVQNTCGYDDPNISLFNLLYRGIATLSSTEYIEHLTVFFTIHLLKIEGIIPDFSRCKNCNKSDYIEFIIDTSDFLPICSKCCSYNSMIPLNRKMKEFIDIALYKKFLNFNHSKFNKKDLLNLLFYLSLFLENYFQIKIKSKALLFSPIMNY